MDEGRHADATPTERLPTGSGRRPARHPNPVGPLVLVLVLGAAILTAGWWAPSAVRTMTTLGDSISSVTRPLVASGPDRTAAALVHLVTTTPEGEGAGTGIVLDPGGVVLTNNHVIQGATAIEAVHTGTARRYRVEVLGYDRVRDLAVLRLVGASGLRPASLGDSDALRLGDPVTALGNAGGRGGEPARAPGVVTALGRAIVAGGAGSDDEKLAGLIQMRAAVVSGYSGGATVDRTGAVVGVTVASSQGPRAQRAGGEGFAIPINQARDTAARILDGRGGPTIHTGPTAALDVETVEDRISEPTGSLAVVDARPGSSAEAAGVRAGDVLTAVDGRPVRSRGALVGLLDTRRPGDRVRVSWLDASGAQRSGTVTLVPGPPG